MNLFNIHKYDWWKHMENIVQNIDLLEILFSDSFEIQLKFFDSQKKQTLWLFCRNVLLLKFDNDGCYDEDFPHFILDVRVKKLNQDEMESASEYYKHNFSYDKINENYYMINIIGSDICLDLLSKEYELKVM